MYCDRMPSPNDFFDNLVRSETRLYNAAAARLQAEHGIGLGPLEFLRYLRDHDDSRISDLAVAFAVGIGTTSKGIDRYEASGWVTRKPHPRNRRSSILALTPGGRTLVDAAEATFDDEVSSRLSAVLGADEIKTVTDALTRLRRSLEADGVGLPTG